jgi:WhiB family redox-sensing transcriptional regulator
MNDWRDLAACRDEDPELFFPIGTAGPARDQIKRARAVCRRCPVVDECLLWALTAGQAEGIWGGLTAEERRAFRHQSGEPVLDRPSDSHGARK